MEQGHTRLMHAARFSFFALGFLNFAWFSYFLAVSGFFFSKILIVFGVLMLVGTLAALRKWFSQETFPAKAVFLGTIAMSATLMFFAEPTVFSGRDQGSIGEASIELSNHGRLTFSSPASEVFSAMHPSGKALNFPGFFYTDDGSLLTQFPLGYIAWTGAFDSIFGIDGFRVGNGILLSLSILSIFFLVRIFSGDRYATGAALVGACSFLPTWFAKFTLTENLALFLFLFLSLNLILFLRENRVSFFLGAYFSGLLFAVTRIEGVWILAVTIAVLFLSKKGRAFGSSQKLILRTLPLVFAALVLAVNFIATLPFQITMAKALGKNLSSIGTAAVKENAATFAELWSIFLPYGLALVFIGGIVGIALFIRKRRWDALMPTLLALPTFLYFIDPNITQDHPWMLRRFLFSLWPTLLFSAVVAFSMIPFRRKRCEAIVAGSFLVIALAFQSPAFVGAFTFAENRGLSEATRSAADLVGENDLLLTDRDATGDPFSMISGPVRFLFGKQAAYFFDPRDYEKIPRDRFDRILLLAPKDGMEMWKSMPVGFVPLAEIPFSFERFEKLPLSESRLPGKETLHQTATLYQLIP